MAALTPPPSALDVQRIAGISLDLDDTLWPIWPTIERAERALSHWLQHAAPKTAVLLQIPGVRQELRERTAKAHANLAHDLSALRRESIRAALLRAGEDPALAEPGFEVFFAERQCVTLYEDVLPSLQWLSDRYPLVAVSNGNADVHRTGVGRWFRSALSAREFGSGKPHAAIFHAAAAAVGLPAKHMLHVGDDLALDVVGALDAGMQAAWVVREAPSVMPEVRAHLVVSNLHALCQALGGQFNRLK